VFHVSSPKRFEIGGGQYHRGRKASNILPRSSHMYDIWLCEPLLPGVTLRHFF
jgi:hypothetical protein